MRRRTFIGVAGAALAAGTTLGTSAPRLPGAVARRVRVEPLAHTVFGEFAGRAWSFADFGPGPLQTNLPSAAASAPDGRVFVVNTGNHGVLVLGADGAPIETWGRWGAGPGEFRYPRDLAFDAAGLLHVADTLNHRVQVLDADGRYVREYGAGLLNGPRALALRADGHVAVLDAGSRQIFVFDPAGRRVGTTRLADGRLLPARIA